MEESKKPGEEEAKEEQPLDTAAEDFNMEDNGEIPEPEGVPLL